MAGIRYQPIARELEALVRSDTSPEFRKKVIADTAREALQRAQEDNKAVLGRVPEHETFINGRASSDLMSADPDAGTIAFVFELSMEMFEWIDAQLILHSPVLTTRYARSHILFADGEQADPLAPTKGDVFVFLNIQPYARKIERGLSKRMAPDGVYEVVAALANRRFGNLARITFSYRSFQGGKLIYNPGALELRSEIQRRAGVSGREARRRASKIIKRERDTRQPAIVITF